MAEPPKDADQNRMADASLPAHDRRDRDDMVRIGCMAHAKNKAERSDGDKRDHFILRPQLWHANQHDAGQDIPDIRPCLRRFWRTT